MTERPEYEYRERCLEAKGESCDICGATDDIVVHHKDGKRENNDLENLVPLCDEHHRKVHSRHPEVAELVRKLGYEPSGGERTSIEVTDETWTKLKNRKTKPGMTFDDVLRALLED